VSLWNFQVNTLLLYLSLDPYRWTDRQTERRIEGAKPLEGRVARLILLIVVSVCVVFCVLCCLQNNPVFSSVTISHILKNENYELCFSAGSFVDQITTGKKYSRLAVGWNKSQITICRVKIRTPPITL
jgi:hypothetical protein